jgi:Resolvase, N terminal domain
VKTLDPVDELLRREIPGKLWHYTSVQGFHGIVSSRQIFATDVRYLNDSKEFTHARRFGRSLRHLVNALAELEARGVTFVSLRDNWTSAHHPGASCSKSSGLWQRFERSLIQERVIAGLRNAKAKGTTLGRPRLQVDEPRIKALRDSGAFWSTISREVGLAWVRVRRVAQRLAKNLCAAFSENGAEVICA